MEANKVDKSSTGIIDVAKVNRMNKLSIVIADLVKVNGINKPDKSTAAENLR